MIRAAAGYDVARPDLARGEVVARLRKLGAEQDGVACIRPFLVLPDQYGGLLLSGQPQRDVGGQ